MSAYLGAYENYWYNHGALELSWTLSYFMNMAQDVLAKAGDVERLAELEKLKADPEMRFSPLTDDALRHLPIQDWVERFGRGAPFLADILHHEKDGPYWWAVDLRRQFQDIDVPILHVGSWYDIANWDTPAVLHRAAGRGDVGADARAPGAVHGPLGPPAALQPTHLRRHRRRRLRPRGRLPRAGDAEGVVRPLRPGRPRRAAAGPGTPVRHGGGPLARRGPVAAGPGPPHAAVPARRRCRSTSEPPGDEEPGVYVYDPEDPVPTAGGRYVGGGVRDQRANQARDDVLVHTAAPVTEVLEITGPVTLTLFVSTDAPDTDFVAVLSDVQPDGFVRNLAEGLVRMRYRESYDEPSLLEPGVVHEVRIELGNVSHALLPGHALRVHVTSSDFPRWDRNPNTGELPTRATTTRRAAQTVHHDRAHPSALSLPVCPRV